MGDAGSFSGCTARTAAQWCLVDCLGCPRKEAVFIGFGACTHVHECGAAWLREGQQCVCVQFLWGVWRILGMSAWWRLCCLEQGPG